MTGGLTLLAMFELDPEGIALFEEYERLVLPFLAEYGGRLERRMRNPENTMEFHIVWFPSDEAFRAYRDDTRRLSHQPLFEQSKTVASVYPVVDFAGDGDEA